MRGIILHTIYSARRDKFLVGILLGMIFVSLISGFLGSTALTEGAEMKAIYASNACRMVVMIGMMVFISFHIKRLFENKEMDVFLSRVPSRASIVLSFLSAFYLVAIVAICQAILILSLIYMQNFVNILIWGFTLMLEAMIVVVITTFFAMVIRSSTIGLLLCFAAYILCRVIGNFVAYIDVAKVSLSFHSITEVLLKILSVLIPRLDLFGKSSLIIYSEYGWKLIGILLLQSVVYSVFISLCTILDMRTREF